MFFSVTDGRSPLSTPAHGFLRYNDKWNDFNYRTGFMLIVIDASGARHDIGGFKVGRFGMKTDELPGLPNEFDVLDDRFFSVGESENYYETLNRLPDSLGQRVLEGLRDVAYDLSLFDKALQEPVMRLSLLRSGGESRPSLERLRASEERVRGRLSRLARGDARLTPFSFTYTFPAKGGAPAPVLSFEVEIESQPPTNIHVLSGRNGVGKTRCLQNMARSLVIKNPSTDELGGFASKGSDGEARGLFANLVSITFSAFDPFGPIVAEGGDDDFAINYSYVGLRKSVSVSQGAERKPTKDLDELTREFIESAEHCRTGFRRDRWLRALETLSSDPLFSEANVSTLARKEEEAAFAQNAAHIYEHLSSGHKIVLLMITRLVELVEERTLVLLDEPEAHLHPPLLAAFMRALSNLLVQRNGVAIVATHSPVVLQEVPKACVNILYRVGLTPRSDRPGIETFGENVGVLTREVFGLEVTQSGYHRLLQDAVADKSLGYEDVLRRFGDQLGAEARAIVAALVAVRDAGDEKDSVL